MPKSHIVPKIVFIILVIFYYYYYYYVCKALFRKAFVSYLDKPSKPGTPEITDYDESSADIRWAPSESDGGSPITHYIIQKREGGSTKEEDWVKVDVLDTPTGNEPLENKVVGLVERSKVQFRVIAVNKGGESEPSDPSPVHTVKHRKLKPRIDRTNIEGGVKSAKVGGRIALDVDVIGEPCPETTWTLMGAEVTTKDNITVVHTEYNTKLTVEAGTRRNSARYKITATNIHGKDEEFVELVFLGRPGAPMGPLEVYGVTEDSCKLSWRPPEDDGGLPIKEYLVEKMDKETGKWVPVCRTPPETTNCPVKGLQPGHEYLFRVKAVNEEGESEPLTADKAIIAKNPYGNDAAWS